MSNFFTCNKKAIWRLFHDWKLLKRVSRWQVWQVHHIWSKNTPRENTTEEAHACFAVVFLEMEITKNKNPTPRLQILYRFLNPYSRVRFSFWKSQTFGKSLKTLVRGFFSLDFGFFHGFLVDLNLFHPQIYQKNLLRKEQQVKYGRNWKRQTITHPNPPRNP